MEKLNYAEFTKRMREHNTSVSNPHKENLNGVIVITSDSFIGEYSLAERSYRVSSASKAWLPNMSGYSIFSTSLEGNDYVKLTDYLADEYGGKDGWQVEYCYFV